MILSIEIPDDLLKDLVRFNETYDDGQEYDVPKERMMELAKNGLVRYVGFRRFTFTQLGNLVLEEYAANQTAKS